MVEIWRQLVVQQAEIPIYDLRGLKCPLPVLKTRNRLRSMQSDSLLWVETSDPLAGIDLPHFCAQEGHELVQHLQEPGLHRFLIRKK